MKESATCALCGHGYAYPADLDVKAGMHCASCGALIYAKTGLPFGEAPTSGSLPGAGISGKKDGPAASRQKEKYSGRFRTASGHTKTC